MLPINHGCSDQANNGPQRRFGHPFCKLFELCYRKTEINLQQSVLIVNELWNLAEPNMQRNEMGALTKLYKSILIQVNDYMKYESYYMTNPPVKEKLLGSEHVPHSQQKLINVVSSYDMFDAQSYGLSLRKHNLRNLIISYFIYLNSNLLKQRYFC